MGPQGRVRAGSHSNSLLCSASGEASVSGVQGEEKQGNGQGQGEGQLHPEALRDMLLRMGVYAPWELLEVEEETPLRQDRSEWTPEDGEEPPPEEQCGEILSSLAKGAARLQCSLATREEQLTGLQEEMNGLNLSRVSSCSSMVKSPPKRWAPLGTPGKQSSAELGLQTASSHLTTWSAPHNVRLGSAVARPAEAVRCLDAYPIEMLLVPRSLRPSKAEEAPEASEMSPSHTPTISPKRQQQPGRRSRHQAEFCSSLGATGEAPYTVTGKSSKKASERNDPERFDPPSLKNGLQGLRLEHLDAWLGLVEAAPAPQTACMNVIRSPLRQTCHMENQVSS
ncbi:unnamed protein product [Chrysoparadoxa australica]